MAWVAYCEQRGAARQKSSVTARAATAFAPISAKQNDDQRGQRREDGVVAQQRHRQAVPNRRGEVLFRLETLPAFGISQVRRAWRWR
ncbi:MAG: hypothetical protein ACLUI3_15235 [Christensenellales bacterium]